jgi:hypothetical protein
LTRPARFTVRTLALAAGALASAAALAGCSASAAPDTAAPKPTATSSTTAVTNGTFGPFVTGGVASTYDTTALPTGSQVFISMTTAPDGTTAWVRASGLPAHGRYHFTVHEHVCGKKASTAGGVYKAADGGKAEGSNIVRVSLRADGAGSAQGTSKVPWNLRHTQAASMVVTAAGDDSKALGCVTLS